jgi:hypothetical protein
VDLPAYREEVRRCVECAMAEGPTTAVDDRQGALLDDVLDVERSRVRIPPQSVAREPCIRDHSSRVCCREFSSTEKFQARIEGVVVVLGPISVD